MEAENKNALASRIAILEKNDKRLLVVLFLLTLALVFFLFFRTDHLFPSEMKVIGTLKTNSHVRIRRNGTLVWFDGKEGEQIFLRDMVYIPESTQSFITLAENNETVELPEDTLIHFDEVTLEDLMIYLREGLRAPRLVPRKMPETLEKNLPDLTVLINRLGELRQRTYDKVFNPEELEAPDPLNSKFRDYTLSDFELELILPEKGANLNARQEKTLQFVWSKIPLRGVSFTIEISTTGGFGNALEFTTEKGNQLFIQLDRAANYTWHIKAKWHGQTIQSFNSHFRLKNEKLSEK